MARIVNRFTELLAIKRRDEGKSWSYEDVSQRTGLSTGTLVRYAKQDHSMFDENTGCDCANSSIAKLGIC